MEILVNWKTGDALQQLELWAIRCAMKITKGKSTKAARVLGISVRTLRNKVRLHPELSDLIKPRKRLTPPADSYAAQYSDCP